MRLLLGIAMLWIGLSGAVGERWQSQPAATAGATDMRSVKYRDVLWAVARKDGLDPKSRTQELLDNDAASKTEWINSWLREYFDVADHPEWTRTRSFIPDANHIVAWDPVVFAAQGEAPPQIGRVWKVYLADPLITDGPIDTPFRLRPEGVHCGFEHGTAVWIKYTPPAPRFTSEPWDPDVSYGKGDLVYSSKTGECYKSKVSGNRGHDPTNTFQPPTTIGIEQEPIPLETELVQSLTPNNPGLSPISKILDLVFLDSALVDPPPAGTFFSVTTVDPVSFDTHTANGVESLTTIMNALRTGLIGIGWPGTIVVDGVAKTMRFTNASDFYFDVHTIWTPPSGGPPIHYLKIFQIGTFIPAVAGVDGEPQIINFPLTSDQIVPGATYQFEFKDVSGVSHTVEYLATETDTVVQILSGLLAAVGSSQGTDAFFKDVLSSLDTTSLVASFSTLTAVSLDASMLLPGSPYWEVERFPKALMNPIMRAAFSDVLREEGQTDKAMEEEKSAAGQNQVAIQKAIAPGYDALTDQVKPRSRYQIR